jgi:hypothetical protein
VSNQKNVASLMNQCVPHHVIIDMCSDAIEDVNFTTSEKNMKDIQ